MRQNSVTKLKIAFLLHIFIISLLTLPNSIDTQIQLSYFLAAPRGH